MQLGTIKKEGTLQKSRMDFRKNFSIGNTKSKRSRKFIVPIEKNQKKNSNLISKKESVSIGRGTPKREVDSRKVSRELLDRRVVKPSKKTDRLKLFRIVTKEKKSFEVSENVLNKVASADFDSEKKMKDDEPISLSTRKTEFFRYFKHIKVRIEESWVWWAPEARGLHGKLKLRFTLLRDGSLKKLVLLESSGHGVLDDEAMSAVTRASVSFRPFPLKMKRKFLNIDGTFEYVSERFFVRKFLRN
ncbi:MAG: energy transducer TonB [Nitrospinota bacterium]|nr:energy transducer TonB [Nitrospinota bacterium]